MRIGGLASGMDIDQLVKDLMKAERMPLDKMYQKKQILEWQRDDYREMNSLLLSLRNEMFNMRLSSNFRIRNATSSNESKVTATASSAAGTASYTITEVKQLAEAASKVSTSAVSAGTKIDTSRGLYEIQGDFANSNFNWKKGSVENQTITASAAGTSFSLSLKPGASVLLTEAANMVVKVDGKAYTVVTSGTPNTGEVLIDASGNLTFGDTIKKGSTIKVDYMTDVRVDDDKTLAEATNVIQLQKGSIVDGSLTLDIDGTTYTNVGNEIQDASGTKVGTIDLNTGKITMDNTIAEGSVIKATYQQNYFTFGITTYNEKSEAVNEKFAIQGNESLNTVINKVNSSDAGVTMFYDSFSDKVTITRTETGNFNGTELDPEIVTSGSFLNDVLYFNGAAEFGGKNAIFTINGLETERTSNTFSISGVTFTLKDTFTTADPSVTIAISNDADKVVEKIKAFVEKYNETIDKIQQKISEERYRDYLPLTEEQKEAMSEKQIELWEEKAKSGLLRRDSILSSALSELRYDAYQPVTNDKISSKYNQLASIGITTSPNYLDGGKLIIDEAKLKAAIEEDPEAVEALFNSSGTDESEKGIVQRMYDTITNAMDKINEKAGKSTSVLNTYTIGKNLEDLEDRIDAFERRLVDIENRYWRQFTAMETAIQRMNEQSMYLMQQFGMGY
ncbi:flagellar filament capping protein FliD [Aeribacillus alveayuensis]|uniref:Flagellar hook-associated protein 2 n=1 Tax=Aeribacillus alveayuensis TaxID=279215 RepID=A0ABT9VLU6_9BACI|nr:flagellar hook-associated protein 2 [Bacillus alveayuensis]